MAAAQANRILTMESENIAVMLKKLLLFTAIALCLFYGSGNDFGSMKRHINGAMNDNARTVTAGDNGGWGNHSGY